MFNKYSFFVKNSHRYRFLTLVCGVIYSALFMDTCYFFSTPYPCFLKNRAFLNPLVFLSDWWKMADVLFFLIIHRVSYQSIFTRKFGIFVKKMVFFYVSLLDNSVISYEISPCINHRFVNPTHSLHIRWNLTAYISELNSSLLIEKN